MPVAMCINRTCGRQYWYYPEGSFDEFFNRPIPPSQPPKHCRSCGWRLLVACPGCNMPLDRLPTEEERYCEGCGADLLSVETVDEVEPPHLAE